jgi:hypothetical protein
VDAEALEVALVGEGAEIPEGRARAQADRGPDAVADEAVEAGAPVPREGDGQHEPAPDRPLVAPRADCPDIDEEDVPVEVPAGRVGEAAGDLDVVPGFASVEGVGPIGPIVEGQAGGPAGGDRGQDGQEGRPVGPPGKGEPAGRDGRRSEDRCGRGPEGKGRGRGYAQDESGREMDERIGAGPQKPGLPEARALWVSRASRTRWLRILTPRGMARSSGLKLGLCRGAIVRWAGSLTPRKK